MLDAKLVVVGGDARTTLIHLQLPCVIGRGREANLVLPHPLVSRRHCELFEEDGKLVVRDLGSLNGTYLNNQRVEKTAVLEPDQLLTLGNVTFRAYYRDTSCGQRSASAEPDGHHNGSPRNMAHRETVYDETPRGSDTDKNLPVPEKVASAGGRSQSTSQATSQSTSASQPGFDSDESEAPTQEANAGQASSDSDRIVIDAPEEASPNRSISLSSLDELPKQVAASSSFLRQIPSLDGDSSAPSSIESKLDLDGGERRAAPIHEDSSGLDKFLNRLPS